MKLVSLDPPKAKAPAESDAAKRLSRTTELVLALIAAILVPANEVLDLGLPTEALVGVIGLAVAYATSRTLAKSTGEKIRAGVRTTEFYVAVGSSVGLLLVEHFGFDLTPEQVAMFVAAIAALLTGRGAQKRAAAGAQGTTRIVAQLEKTLEELTDRKLRGLSLIRKATDDDPARKK